MNRFFNFKKKKKKVQKVGEDSKVETAPVYGHGDLGTMNEQLNRQTGIRSSTPVNIRSNSYQPKRQTNLSRTPEKYGKKKDYQANKINRTTADYLSLKRHIKALLEKKARVTTIRMVFTTEKLHEKGINLTSEHVEDVLEVLGRGQGQGRGYGRK